MSESATSYWTRILKAMVERNRANLSELAYRNVLTALENKVDARALREVAVETATSLGRREGPRSQPKLGDTALDIAYREKSQRSAPPIPSMAIEPRDVRNKNSPKVKRAHRRPAPRPP